MKMLTSKRDPTRKQPVKMNHNRVFHNRVFQRSRNSQGTDLEETVGHQETRLLVRAVANLNVGWCALEMPAEAAIHTVRLPP